MKWLWEVEREANKLCWNIGSVSIFLPYIDWSMPFFFRIWVSRDAEHIGEVQNDFTSCFARQTGSALIFPPVIAWFNLLSQWEGFSGCGTPWWSQKCCCFLFCLPNRKCQRFPACNWLIRAIFSRRRLLWMRKAMVKLKMASLPVLLPKQEVPAFSCL